MPDPDIQDKLNLKNKNLDPKLPTKTTPTKSSLALRNAAKRDRADVLMKSSTWYKNSKNDFLDEAAEHSLDFLMEILGEQWKKFQVWFSNKFSKKIIMLAYSLTVWKKKSFNKLTSGLLSSGGRTSSGRISVYHRGGGLKFVSRTLDYKRFIWNVPGFVFRIEYNPVIRALVSFIVYCNGISNYILAPNSLSVGQIVRNGTFYQSNTIGACFNLSSFPIGSFVHNIELHSQHGGQFLRAMGSYGRLMSKTAKTVNVKLRSGKLYSFPHSVIATNGTLDSFNFIKKIHNKAGFFRLRGIRPSVRGVAMNPIDHPHGGGEGKSSAGRPSVSRWGWLTKNVKKKS